MCVYIHLLTGDWRYISTGYISFIMFSTLTVGESLCLPLGMQ